MARLLLATNNPGKVREFRRLLTGTAFEVVTPGEVGITFDVEETGATYAENAEAKARAAAALGGCIALADDSGIEVDALGGRPGMYSARYGGPDLDDVGRTALLLSELSGVPPERRTARYRAIVAVATPDGQTWTFEGVEEGRIGHAPRGANGFGYDPVFLVDGDRTQAELSDEEKDRISHRGEAMRAAIRFFESNPA